MDVDELLQLHAYLVDEVKKAYRDALEKNTHEVSKKELNDIATFTDRYMEERIGKAIHARYPDHRLIGEEYGDSGKDSPYDWLIDPIDGTINYAAGIPMFGTSVALRKNGQAIYGLIIDWPNDTVYYGIRGYGSFCGGERLHVSNRTKLDEAVLTMCITSSYDQETLEKALAMFRRLHPYLRGIRVIVCTVYELVWLASGKTDLMLNIKPSIGVSSCAGKLIIEEAGGKVTNLQGEPRKEKDTLLISNSLLHNQIVQIINKP